MAAVLVSVAGFIVGFIVGLTGMGGGALMTPIMVLVFGVQRHGAVNRRLVLVLCIGSVPAAFSGVLLLHALDTGEQFQNRLKTMLGLALLLAAASMIAKNVVDQRRGRKAITPVDQIRVRPVLTIAIGLFGGLMVGLTSVGSGSLIIVLLLLLYPMLSAKALVGTDLVQAIPLVAAATLGHLLFGDFQLGLTLTLLVGAIPGVYLGARVSTRAPDQIIRPVLILVLLISALKLLGVSTGYLGLAFAGGLVLLGLFLVRRHVAKRAAAPAIESITQPSSATEPA